MLIAVLDSGAQADHPDLRGRLVAGSATDDPRGTGTHAAGAAAAATDNGTGIAGAAPDAEILALRVLDDDGRTGPDALRRGIRTATEAGAGVLALTLGAGAGNLAVVADEGVRTALTDAADAGIVVVVGTVDGVEAPRGLPVVLVATGGGEAPVDAGIVSGPGTGVLATAPFDPTATWPQGTDGYETLGGPGPATALVAGAAALLVAQGLTPTEIADLLVATARNPTGDPALGAGTVDAAAAVVQGGLVGAGGATLPEPDDGEEGLAPAAVGAIAVGAAVLAVGATVLLAGRRPRPGRGVSP